jgi:hypothetical protein
MLLNAVRRAHAERRQVLYRYVTLLCLLSVYFPNHDVFLRASFRAFCYVHRQLIPSHLKFIYPQCISRPMQVDGSRKRTHCSLQSLYALFTHTSASIPSSKYAGTYSLEEIRTHSPLAAIALQTLYAPIRSFLTRVEVLAVRFAICAASAHVFGKWKADERVELGGCGTAPFFGLVVRFGTRFVAHRARLWCERKCWLAGKSSR